MSSERNGDMTKEVTLMSGRHFLFPKTKLKYEISVTNLRIRWTLDSPSGSSHCLNFTDILGCDCVKGKSKQDTNAYITVYAYPHKKKFASKKTVRHRQTLTFAFDNQNSFEDNSKDAEPWRNLIMCLARNIPVQSVDEALSVSPPTSKKLLVLVNPFSGPGKALSIFQQRVVPILAEANIHFNMVITEYAGHAFKLVQSLVLEQWYGIVIVSGDGLIYEVVNGLMQHEDWERAIKVPLGCLPGGSGNALAAALLHAAGEPYLDNCVLHSAVLLAKHELLPMDLVAVDTASGKRLYSFLSVTWGIIADVDIGSERYRSLGPVRFTIEALVRIVNLRKYHGRVSFIPVAPYNPPQPLQQQSKRYSLDADSSVHPQTIRRSQSEMASVSRQQAPNRDPDEPRTPDTENQEGLEKAAQGSTESAAGKNGANENGAIGNGASENGASENEASGKEVSANGASKSGSSENRQPEEESVAAGTSAGGDNNGHHTQKQSMSATSPVPTPLLPPLSEPLPPAANWVTIEDDFILVSAIYQTHLSIDMMSTPGNELDDGLIHLGLIRSHGMTRTKLLRIMTAMEDGSHVGLEGLEMVPCTAFRIQPTGHDDGIMAVDGEAIDFGAVQGQVLPSMARVMARNSRGEGQGR